ncbi:hypothetical protein CkaCkLH20_07877 [Colletotrichum karsti]|uniref:Uncharacterized protein n=1 Tax=Colletotrichum karsti TaxID=1095194 RepID=A0A9P6LJD8_9PEZI|nr:uncharacterized protein CkaCkLH20_07877 [Colletotrichum karsti]KAF9874740.1 hypothetical protein CkaCkLH20_07877 [Colletotrichum karsti]
MRATLLFLLGFLSPVWVRAESRFRRPPGPGYVRDYRDNNAYVRGEYLDIGWDMDFKSAKLVLWQEYDTTKALDYVILQENTTDSKYKWKISDEGFVNPNLSNVYYFELVEAGKDMANWAVTCHYFNITDPVTATTNTTETTEPIESDSVKEQALSAGTALGIGIGATLGAVLLIGVGGWLIFRCLRNKKTSTEGQYMEQPIMTGSSPSYQEVHGYDTQQTASPVAPTEWTLQTSQVSSMGHHLHEAQANNVVVRHEMYAEQIDAHGTKSPVGVADRVV